MKWKARYLRNLGEWEFRSVDIPDAVFIRDGRDWSPSDVETFVDYLNSRYN